MYELGYCSLPLLLCEWKLITFSKDNTQYEYDLFSRSKQVAAVTECTSKNFFLSGLFESIKPATSCGFLRVVGWTKPASSSNGLLKEMFRADEVMNGCVFDEDWRELLLTWPGQSVLLKK